MENRSDCRVWRADNEEAEAAWRDLAVNREGTKQRPRQDLGRGFSLEPENLDRLFCEGTVQMDSERLKKTRETAEDAGSWWQETENLEQRLHLGKRDCPLWIRSKGLKEG